MNETPSPSRKERFWRNPFVAFLKESLLLYFDCRGPQAAACFSYFVVLTAFPILICVSSILGLLHIDIVVVEHDGVGKGNGIRHSRVPGHRPGTYHGLCTGLFGSGHKGRCQQN